MTEERRIPTRMGDGTIAHLTPSELRADIEAGSALAAKRAKVPMLSAHEQAHLLEIYASPARFVGVDIGDEVILSCDGTI
jgi:dimethylamine--corrinoid protein Co-methyltransferase